MRTTQLLLRWIPTFLAFPLAGFLAQLALGPIRDPLAAAVAGAMVGSALGLTQFWALKPLGVTFDWVWATAVSLMVGSPLAWVLVQFETTVFALTIWGLLAGLVVGIAQGLSQRLRLGKLFIWGSAVSASWGLAWFISANVIVDADANYAVFGSTGAVTATMILTFAIKPLFAARGV